MSKFNKIKNELTHQYTDYKMNKDGYYGEC